MKIDNLKCFEGMRGILVTHLKSDNRLINMPVYSNKKSVWINDKSNIGMWHLTPKTPINY